eukprot:CAMPEP_0185012056 /NCGR_PEP_ID=MMETSP1098-20130426/98108_1 /TAXON_ID=89044 /ORGANISM="Spumella elongata, Strain CCAP 955/1" /LENGTH=184 /DNA_ID=CAMNT_0027541107 /DNA_START=31 /DNA_END=585 /DNA_ORIENTATION=+
MTEASASNKALINKFYTAFAGGDAKTMQSCYHESIVFEDPAFGVLTGSKAGDMWEMLLSGPRENPDVTKTLTIEHSNVEATATSGSANWVAHYKFSGNPVENKIKATFEFKDGLIIQHTDVFDFWVWSSQALGLTGYFLGWTSFLNNQVKGQTNGKLAKFVARKYAPAESSLAEPATAKNGATK